MRLLLPCLASIAALPAARSEDGVRLTRALLEGDAFQLRSEVTLELEGTLPPLPAPADEPAAASEDRPFRARFHLRERTRDTLSKVEEGSPKEVSREILESALESRASAGDADPTEAEIARPLAGRTLTLRREGEEARVVRGAENVPSALLAAFEMEHPLVRLLPGGEVTEGDAWSADAAILAPFLRLALAGGVDPVDLEGALECTYEGEETFEESKADLLEVGGTVKGAFGFVLPDGTRVLAPLDLAVEGKAWFDRGRGRFAQFEATIEAESRAGGPAPEAATVPLAAEGRLRLLLQFRGGDSGGEGIRLALRCKPGDVFTKKSTGKFDMKLDSFSLRIGGNPVEPGGEAPEFAMRSTSEEATIEEILAVREGAPTSKRIEFVTSRTVLVQDTPAGEEEDESGGEVEGAVVVVTREDDEVEVKVESGDVPEELRRVLHPEEITGFLLPREAVGKGDTWEVEPARFVQFLSGMLPVAGEDREAAEEAFRKFLSGLEGDLEGRLASLETIEGVSAARIALRGDLSLEPEVEDIVRLGVAITGEEPETGGLDELPAMDLSIGVELRGEMLFARDEGRPISLELSGPLRIRFHMEQSQGEFDIETSAAFSGTIEFRLDVRRGRNP